MTADKVGPILVASGLDVLCNISGMMKWGPTLEFSEDDFARILAVNTTSTFAMCKAALPHLIKSKGNIVNTASTAALQGIAYTVAYAASKHGVAAITKSLAIEFAAKGVRINAICPGHVNTPMGNAAPPEGDVDWSLVMRNVPKLENGMCEPRDIAEMFAFLASDQARKVTGACTAAQHASTCCTSACRSSSCSSTTRSGRGRARGTAWRRRSRGCARRWPTARQ